MEDAEVYWGSIFWLLEGLKIVNKEYNFDKKSQKILLNEPLSNKNTNRKYTTFDKDKYSTINKSDPDKAKPLSQQSHYNGFYFYECIVFNEEKEDSLFFQDGEDICEYFSVDKCELILKLLKLYSQKYLYNTEKALSNIHYEFKDNEKYNKMLLYSLKQTDIICEKIFANLYIQYKNGSDKWFYNYEIKRLLFNLKFLPGYSEIRILKIYPLSFNEEVIAKTAQSFTFTDSEDKLGKTKDEIDYEIFCSKIKKIFYDKYALNLKKLETDCAKINDVYYILKIKELKFEKFDSKFVQLKCERLIRSFKTAYMYHNLEIDKNAPNIKDFDSLYNTMLNVYNDVNDAFNVQKYLSLPPKDLSSDKTFKSLKPNAPMSLSEMLEDKISPKVFAKHCSNKLYKNY